MASGNARRTLLRTGRRLNPKFRERILNFSRQRRSSKSVGWLTVLGLVGASSCGRMLGLDDLAFTGPNVSKGGTGGEGQSSGVAGEQTGGSAGRNPGGVTGGNAGQGACGGTCTGVCLEGVCCPKGHANCDDKCFDLLTSAAHCGSCQTTCAAGEVCLEGRCSADCGSLTRCDNDCVDLARNPHHCQSCGNECPRSPPNGTAICAGLEGCAIECDQKGCNSCCPPPPTNGYADCDSDNECVVRCKTDHHACGTDTAACYHDNDVEHCGTSCYDCRQPNTTVRCIRSHCDNACDGPATFPCGDPSGKLGCGFWDFESRTSEGWFIDPNGMTNAWTGTLEATQAQEYSGDFSLAFGFDGDGTGDKHTIDLTVSPCPSGSPVTWPPGRFAFHYFLEPASGFDPPPPGMAEVDLWLRNDNAHVLGFCNTYLNAARRWGVVTCDLIDKPEFTSLSLVFRIFSPWKGTIYIDLASWPTVIQR
jgi:hypothetical protein